MAAEGKSDRERAASGKCCIRAPVIERECYSGYPFARATGDRDSERLHWGGREIAYSLSNAGEAIAYVEEVHARVKVIITPD
jgi:hypothetical protein